MSTRHLRRAYGTDCIIIDNDDEDATNAELMTSDSKSKQFNVYDLLDEDLKYETSDENEVEDFNEEIQPVDNKRTKNKKKKKKKAGKLRKIQDTENIDEIERTVKEINETLGEPIPSSSAMLDAVPVAKSDENILSVQGKYLNAENELRRICGSKIISRENKNHRSRGRIGLRKLWLTTYSNNVFSSGKFGFSMIIDDRMESKDNVQYFVYVHSSQYQHIQMKFFDAVESRNPENIIHVVNYYSYNIDALLQVAEMCKLNEDLQASAKFVEKAVYHLECAFHPLFNVMSGNCRLSYKHQSNRALFIALFKHMLFIGGRACNRTSLELSKFLMSLDPDHDPLAIILIIDFYALRAREYQWFIDFCQHYEKEKNLLQLPNIAYSLALAHFHLGNHDLANELLQNALIMFPGVLLNLLDKCGVEADTKVMGHDHFGVKAKITTSVSLEKLQDLYVIRAYHLWKEQAQTSILSWLENCAHIVMDRVDAKEDFTKFCEVKRKKRYQGQPPRNILRHIILLDIKEVTIDHPDIQNEGAIFSYDPLPPVDSIDIYPKRGTPSRFTSSNSNMFSLFVSSLFIDPYSMPAADAAGVDGINNVNEDSATEFD